ncbi:SCO3242 family prenyltransferase [Streptomyces sp. SP18CS02]|uniref:SCO3242 family prenyltransferase n=1 Tax=Streptomyces sp. SP18CS02 TaxID=3002531 RepID=UPI002E75C1B0|nr:UbiA family prenyltransferase [Streptomyces sp. SP18CS02]MEE1753986.1 UbiA family prenyltransferase [Streptomyces sp. SP18CS02]
MSGPSRGPGPGADRAAGPSHGPAAESAGPDRAGLGGLDRGGLGGLARGGADADRTGAGGTVAGRDRATAGPAGAGPAAPSGGPRPATDPLRAWAELLRVSALFTVPGDALAGAAAAGLRPDRRTALAIGASLCLYEAGMALNDWADRDEDAVDRPHRPIPSGRVTPGAALTASAALTVTGLVLAARAGRAPLAVATALGATVWAYDLGLKHTRAAAVTMGTARALDLLLGATATAAGAGATVGVAAPVAGSAGGRAGGGRRLPGAARPGVRAEPGVRAPRGVRGALPAALLLGVHTCAVTAVSRHEAHGGSTAAPLAALGATAAMGALAAHGRRARSGPGLSPAPARGAAGRARLVTTALAAAYLRTAAAPLLHAALNPSAPLTRRAVGGGIRAMIPLQATLAARGGALGTGLAVMGLAPLARGLARKVSPT